MYNYHTTIQQNHCDYFYYFKTIITRDVWNRFFISVRFLKTLIRFRMSLVRFQFKKCGSVQIL